MLEGLKGILNRSYDDNSLLSEAAFRADDEDVRDRFMEDEEILLMDAEDDPEIEKLIDNIPEAEETDGYTDEEVEELAESLIPENIGNREYRGSFSWMFK